MIPSTWNTWDVRCLNAVMKLPELAEVRVSVYDDQLKRLQENMLWRDVSHETLVTAPLDDNLARLGLHAVDGSFFEVDLKYRDLVFTTTFATDGDGFVYRITPHSHPAHLKFFVNALFRWNAPGSVSKTGTTLELASGGHVFRVDGLGVADGKTPVNATTQGLLFEVQRLYVRCNSTRTPAEIDRYLEQARRHCEADTVSGTGFLEGVPEALTKGVVWNTIYEPLKNRLCTPVARTWCAANGHSFGSYVLFDWDTFFCGILAGVQDKNLAQQQIFSILDEITPDGFVPNVGSQRFATNDRSQPPVGAYCVLKLFTQFGDRSLLEATYDRLARWNAWWMPHRDGNGDGLLEWGSDPCEDPLGLETNNLVAAMYESGLDNSPMYDGVTYNTATHTMELADVGLNSFYALDCWALAEIAATLGKTAAAAAHRAEYQRMREAINALLWDEATGMYRNRDWQGNLSARLSPTNLYPLLAGIPTPHQAERLVREHLLNPEEFWGEFVIPSIARNDPAFADNDYWRGRIWGPMNFLVAEGVKRYGFYDDAFAFAERSRNLFMHEWTAENHIHENYNAVTGDGDDRKNADALYTWGALLAQTAVAEWAEAQPWAGWRLGNLSGQLGSLSGVPFGNHQLSVDCGPQRFCARLDGTPFLEADQALRITSLRLTGSALSFDVDRLSPGGLTVTPPPTVAQVSVSVRGTPVRAVQTGKVWVYDL